jgi:hypothetical protein
MRAHFPHYDYDDMVTAQHELLVDWLKVNLRRFSHYGMRHDDGGNELF